MRIQVDVHGTTPLMILEGRFDAHVIADFRVNAEELISANHRTIEVDLSQVVFMDSSALAEILRLTRTIRDGGGDLVLRNPSHPVRVIFELTALDTAFTIVYTTGNRS